MERWRAVRGEAVRVGIKVALLCISDGFGSKMFDLGRVSRLWIGFEFGKCPLKMSHFSFFFPSGQKSLFGLGHKGPGSEAGQPLIDCRSNVSSGRVGSGRVRAHLYMVYNKEVYMSIMRTSRGHLW